MITGASGGLGRTVADSFVREGWRVVAPAIETELDLGPDIVVAPGTDLTDVDSVGAAVDLAASEPSAPLRAVVNLVGGYAGGANVADSDPDDFEGQFRVNLRPTYLVTRAALPHLVAAGGGSVVCVSSRAAVAPFAGAAGYIASKAAVIAFAQAVAVEYKGDGVRCNAILPSVIDTPANRAAQPDADHSKWVTPAEIAGVIRFLAGDGSRPTSGAAIPVYGRA
jgi:NAD(P)-dependent dehydrogenase (short-subunit alcohol dehydrogenase family)